MLLCDALRAMLLAVLAYGAWRGGLNFTRMLAAAAAGGLLTVAFELARSAWMAQRIETGDLAGRNAQLPAAWGATMRFVGGQRVGSRGLCAARPAPSGLVRGPGPGSGCLQLPRRPCKRPAAFVNAGSAGRMRMARTRGNDFDRHRLLEVLETKSDGH